MLVKGQGDREGTGPTCRTRATISSVILSPPAHLLSTTTLTLCFEFVAQKTVKQLKYILSAKEP